MSHRCIGLVVTALVCAVPIFAADKGEEIAKAYFGLKKPRSTSATATMVLSDKSGAQRSRSLVIREKRDDQGMWSFIEFSTPADVKGTRFLSIPHASGSDEQRIYLPALKKARLIASSGKGGKFVGSDFSFYDLEDRTFGDFTYRFLRDDALDQHACRVIEMTPKSVDSPYQKAEAWVRTGDSFVYRMRLIDKKVPSRVKIMSVLETTVVDGCIIPTKISMTSEWEGTQTLLTLTDLKVNAGGDDAVFTVQYLESK